MKTTTKTLLWLASIGIAAILAMTAFGPETQTAGRNDTPVVATSSKKQPAAPLQDGRSALQSFRPRNDAKRSAVPAGPVAGRAKAPLLTAQNPAPVASTPSPVIVVGGPAGGAPVIGKAEAPPLRGGGKGAWAGSRFAGPTKEWPWTSHPDVPESETDQRRYLELTERFEANRNLAYSLAAAKGWELRGTRADGGLLELVGVSESGLPLYMTTTNANAAISTAVTLVREVNPYASGGALTGSGFRVGVWDGGKIFTTHRELTGRVTIKDAATSNSNHATHVGGTIGASGVTAAAKGMLPAVSIDSYDWNNDAAEMSAAGATTAVLGTTKIAVSNHSYGLITGWRLDVSPPAYYGRYPAREDEKFGQYSSDSREVDQVAFDRPFYLIFKSAGNDRNDNAPTAGTQFQYFDSNNNVATKTYVSGTDPLSDGWDNGGFDTIGGGFGSAKNIITVGAANDAVSGGVRSPASSTISSFSGWGPTDDGRIKPDLVANGVDLYSSVASATDAYANYSGTSMSGPNAAGSAMLLQQLYSRQFGGEVMRASMLKALLLHTADDIGRPGPDYTYGWGLMNVKAAADVIMAHKNYPASNTMVEGDLVASNVQYYTFTYSGSGPIRATIAWTDPAGATVSGLDNTTRALVNDLDIIMTGPVPQVNPYVLNRASPANNATTGDNTVDNVEQIYLASPVAGTYTVRVAHKASLSGGHQRYSLVITGQATTTTGPVIAVNPTSLSATATQGGTNPTPSTFTVRNSGTGTLSYTISENATWLTVSPTSGTSTGELDTINATYAISGLTNGTYNAQITVQSASGGSATIPVQLTITATSVTLANAVDVTSTLTNYGTLPWTGQTAVTHDGVDAGRSGAITHSQETGFTMPVTGPGTISYYAKVDSESGFDFLRFDLDGVQQDSISGNMDWTPKQFTIPSGAHTLRWRYTKDGSASTGADAGFVDQILFIRGGPEIALVPDREMVVTTQQGTIATSQTMTVRNAGLGTLSYTVSDNASWMTVTPASGTSTGETDSIAVDFPTSAALAAGTYNGVITVSGGTGVTTQTLPVRLVVNPIVSTVTFANAVDFTTSTWTEGAGSNAPWIGQSVVTHDGIDAGKSGVITHNQSSRVTTTLTGPGSMTFWWKVDSESNWDYLELWLDGTKIVSISGQTSWSQVSSSLSTGPHQVEFRYTKDASVNTGADTGWVDQFTFTGTRPPQPAATPPSLTMRGDEGSAVPAEGTFNLTNNGGQSYNYTITDNATWLSVTPTSGMVETETDTITVSCNTSGLRAGTYSGSVRVDCGTAGVLIVPVSVQVNSVIAVPVNPTPTAAYSQTFAATRPPTAAQGWTYYSSPEGRIGIVTGVLRMDDSVSEGLYSLNEAVLHANLLNKTGARLRFKHREYSDEDHALPASFTGHANGDGVAISSDGVNWYRIDTLGGATSTFRETVIDLDPVIASLSLSYTSDFLIKFQQYDNYPVSTDGFEFDDITLSVTGTTNDDHGGTPGTATPVILGAVANGRIEVSGDKDLFKVVLPNDTTLMVFTTGTTDTVGTIYAADGTTVIASNDDYNTSALGYNCFMSSPLTTGTYYVEVRGYSSTTGAYVLNLYDGGSDSGRPELPGTYWNYPTTTAFNPFEADWILYPFEGLVYSFYTSSGSSGPQEVMTFDGEMSLTFTGTGYTGTLLYHNASYPVRGTFDRADGTSNVSIPRTGMTPIVLNLAFRETENSPTLTILGTIGIDGQVAYVDLSERLGYAPRAGKYTFLMPADSIGNPYTPGGDGHATMTMATNGSFTLTGKMGDGATFTESGNITSDGFFFLYRSLYTNGWMAGDLKFRYVAGISDADGDVQWVKFYRPTDTTYPYGFDTWVPMLGSSYNAPTTAPAHVLPTLPLGTVGASANFGNGSFFPPLGLHGFQLLDSDMINYSGPAGLTMTINRTDGSFTGSVKQPYTNRVYPFSGVSFQRQGIMSGQVQGPSDGYGTTTGFISIE